MQYEAQISRPFAAADPSTDMTIYADPNNSGGYATSYVFRGVFGPTGSATEKSYQCADQTIDFAAFYGDSAGAMSGLIIGGMSLVTMAASILF